MNFRILPAAVAFMGLSISSSFAGETAKQPVAPSASQDLFRSQGVQFDSFVEGVAGTRQGSTVSGVGGGFGLNYFLTKYIGVGVQNSLAGLNGSWKTYDLFKADLIARLPIESLHLAPYVMVGGGSAWAKHYAHGSGNVGLGAEYRFTPHFGIFVDSVYVFNNAPMNSNVTRGGLRFIF
jgi:hypothetical protein